MSPPQLNELQTIANAVKQAWDGGAPPDTRAALKSHPGLLGDRVLVLELAYEEYCRRKNAGEAVTPEDYCLRFPSYRTSLHRMVSVHHLIERGGALLEEGIPDSWPAPGEQVGDFTLVRELGRGAFARVFLANEAPTGNRPVVVKLTYDVSREAHTLGQIEHENIVPILSAPSEPLTGLNIVCMPFLGSATLEDLLDHAFPFPGSAPPRRAAVILEAARLSAHPGDPLTEKVPAPATQRGNYVGGVVWLGAELAAALAFLHARHIYHCDLKPSNVLIGLDGRPRLLDFNLSAQFSASPARLGGTLPYMAPEEVRAFLMPAQKKKQAPAPDGRADLFSLGVVLYELLTGCHPFAPLPSGLPARKLGDWLLQRCQAGPTPLRTRNADVDAPTARLIESCLAFDRTRRPRDAAFLAEALRQQLGPLGRLRRFVLQQRRRALVGATGLVLLPLGLWLAGTVFPPPPKPPPPPPLTAEYWYQKGARAAECGELDEAERCYREATAVDSAYWPADLALGQLGLVRGHDELIAGDKGTAEKSLKRADKAFDRALVSLERINKGANASWGAYYGKGRALMLLGKPAQAEPFFTKASERYQPARGHAPTQACLAYCLARRGEHKEAIKRSTRAMTLGYSSTALLSNLGYSHTQNGQVPEAQLALTGAAYRDSNFPAAYFNFARWAYLRYLDEHGKGVGPDLLPRALIDVERCLGLLRKTRPRELQEAYALAGQLYGLSLCEDSLQERLPSDRLPSVSWLLPVPPQYPQTQENRRKQGLDYLILACQNGINPVRFTRDPFLRIAFGDDPRYTNLRRAGAPAGTTALALSLIDPVLTPFD